MDHGGEWHLAPTYVLTFSDGVGGEHYLAVAREALMPARGHVDRVAYTCGISPRIVATIIEQVAAAAAGWNAAARDAGVGHIKTALVAARLATIRAAFVG